MSKRPLPKWLKSLAPKHLLEIVAREVDDLAEGVTPEKEDLLIAKVDAQVDALLKGDLVTEAIEDAVRPVIVKWLVRHALVAAQKLDKED